MEAYSFGTAEQTHIIGLNFLLKQVMMSPKGRYHALNHFVIRTYSSQDQIRWTIKRWYLTCKLHWSSGTSGSLQNQSGLGEMHLYATSAQPPMSHSPLMRELWSLAPQWEKEEDTMLCYMPMILSRERTSAKKLSFHKMRASTRSSGAMSTTRSI